MTVTFDLTQEEVSKVEQARHYGIDMTPMIKGLIAGLPTWEPKIEKPLTTLENIATEEGETYGEKLLAKLRAEGALGVWTDRTESSEELAREFRAEAERRCTF